MKKITLLLTGFLFAIFTSVNAQYTDTLYICPNVSKEVDALIQIQNGNPLIQDVNFSTNGQLLIDAWTQGGQLKVSRTLMRWDFSSIPAGSTIQNATLELFQNTNLATGNSTESGSNEAWVERITQDWDGDSVTWTTQPPSTITDRAQIITDNPLGVRYIRTDATVDISTLVQYFIDNPTDNHGIKIKLATEQNYRRRSYFSSDYIDSTKHPRLIIEYTTPTTPHLKPLYCGAINVALQTQIQSVKINGAISYEFKFDDGNGNIFSHVSTNHKIRLKNITPLPIYGTTYNVTVRGSDGVNTSPYGVICQLTLENIPSPTIDSTINNRTDVVFDEVLRSSKVIGATGYEFEVVNLDIGYTENYTSTNRIVKLKKLTNGVAYNTNYEIRVRAIVGNATGTYGQITTFRTANIVTATTELKPNSCGKINVKSNNKLKFKRVKYIATHQIIVSDVTKSDTMVTDSSFFRLSDFTNSTFNTNTVYNVKIKPIGNGLITSYGQTCNITTINLQTTQLKPNFCGKTGVLPTDLIKFNHVPFATKYEVLVHVDYLGDDTIIVTNNQFTLNDFSNLNFYSMLNYEITILPLSNNIYGNYGNTCILETVAALCDGNNTPFGNGFTATIVNGIHCKRANSFIFNLDPNYSEGSDAGSGCYNYELKLFDQFNNYCLHYFYGNYTSLYSIFNNYTFTGTIACNFQCGVPYTLELSIYSTQDYTGTQIPPYIATQTIIFPCSSPIELSVSQSPVCSGQNNVITVDNATSGWNYTWSPPGCGGVITGNPFTICPTISTTYTVTASDGNTSCSENIDVLVYSPVASATVSTTQDMCCDGAINVTINGGVEPYTYVYNSMTGYTGSGIIPFNGIHLIENLCADTYGVTITDAVGCSVDLQDLQLGACTPDPNIKVIEYKIAPNDEHYIDGQGTTMIFDRDKYIDGDITLKNGTFIIKNSRWIVQSCPRHNDAQFGAIIKLENNAELILQGGTITAYCDVVWSGIHIDATSKLSTKGNKPNEISLMHYGIESSATAGVIGAVIDIKNVSFNNNFRGVYGDFGSVTIDYCSFYSRPDEFPYPNKNLGWFTREAIKSSSQNTISTITNCTFDGVERAIQDGSTLGLIENCTFDNIYTYGISAFGNNITVRGCTFNLPNIQFTTPYINGNAPLIGIRTGRGQYSSNLLIENNIIQEVTSGYYNPNGQPNIISVGNSKEHQAINHFNFLHGVDVFIQNNQFLNTNYGVKVAEISPTANFNIEDGNYFFQNQVGVSIQNFGGLWFSTPPNYEIRCNYFSYTNTGIRIESNTVLDNLGGANTVADPTLPSANTWNGVINYSIQNLSQINLVGRYFPASDEIINPAPFNINVTPINNNTLNKFNSCK